MQIDSFEATLPASATLGSSDGQPPTFRAVFIRAPAILSVKPGVEVRTRLAIVPPPPVAASAGGHDTRLPVAPRPTVRLWFRAEQRAFRSHGRE